MSQFQQRWSLTQQDRVAPSTRTSYPFSALVEQDEMKLALLLNAVAPQIAGVLVHGEKGTAKSTAVRALQALLPPITVVDQCTFGCDPANEAFLCESCTERLEAERRLPTLSRPVRLVELPLGATEDRVLGTLDLERAIKDGIRHFEPGLLAAAHRGILYIDEVNLLPDHLVDALLDTATTGRNVVEREGISFTHPAQFLLIGTMNPEEGELRPQLLDRFGLSVEVHATKDLALRTEVVKRRIAFESNAAAFSVRWREDEVALRTRIVAARQLLPQIVVPESILGLISFLCVQADVEGLRADLTIYKAATALAALEERVVVTEHDVQRVALMALAHRQRRQPFEQPGLDTQALQQTINEYQPSKQTQQEEQEVHSSHRPNGHTTDPPPSQSETGETTSQPPMTPASNSDNNDVQPTEHVIPPGLLPAPVTLKRKQTQTNEAAVRKPIVQKVSQAARTGTAIVQTRGRSIGVRHPGQTPSSLALVPTLRAAALHQQRRRVEHAQHEGQRFWIEHQDILEPVRQQKHGALILFVVDASGSMAARKRMATAKGAVLALLQHAYQERDQVGFIQFRGAKATTLLAPTTSISQAFHALVHLPTGGRTPLASALRLARRTLQAAQRRDSQRQRVLVLVTDGRANVVDAEMPPSRRCSPLEDARSAAYELRAVGVSALVIDTEEGASRMGLANQLADALGGTCVELATFEAPRIAHAVQSALGRTQTWPLKRKNESLLKQKERK
ncbi:MAG: putative cobaltochelatase [Ktedonobacteraceae bacterium]